MENEKIKITHPERILTLANFISLLRVILVLPLIYYLDKPDAKFLLVLLIVIIIASDLLDGFIARRANEVTHLGMWLDPLADSIVIVSVTFYLVLADKFPMWFFIFFIIRYISITLPGVYLINHTQVVNGANYTGKLATATVTIMLVLHVFQIPVLESLKQVSVITALILLSISWVFYIKRYLNIFNSIYKK